MADNRKTKGLRTPPLRWVSPHYMFVSVHDSNHDGVVRIFVGISYGLGGIISLFTLHCVAQFSLYQESDFCEGWIWTTIHRMVALSRKIWSPFKLGLGDQFLWNTSSPRPFFSEKIGPRTNKLVPRLCTLNSLRRTVPHINACQ